MEIEVWNTVIYETKGRVAHIRLNRPEVRNAIDPQMMRDLPEALREADADDEIRVIVLSGAGRSFGSGYDLKTDWGGAYGKPAGHTPASMRRALRDSAMLEFGPWDCEKPTVAMVRGACLAGSCELAMMCCITIASETAFFGEPEIRFSSAPPVMVMPWLIGLKKARELLYLGETIDAAEALRLGMINRVVPDDKLEEHTFGFARRVANVDLEALKTTKAAINRGAEIAGFRAAMDYGLETGSILNTTPSETYKQFKEIAKKEGVAAAVRWREAQFDR
jgi:enoyl-CoA hydratase/carnithine racemase